MGIKSITKTYEIQIAKSSHKCSSNSRHLINKGDRRLSIREGRSSKTYCLECADKILNTGVAHLLKTLESIKKTSTSSQEGSDSLL